MTHHTRCEAFKRRRLCQYVLCCRGYDERVVASSSHQIQSEYYGGNTLISIEVIILENFSATTHSK